MREAALPERQAIEVLVADLGGPTMFARIGVTRQALWRDTHGLGQQQRDQ